MFADLGEILAAGGCGYEDLGSVRAYLTDVADRPLLDGPLRTAFGAARPAATLVGVPGLAVPGAKIELDAVAVVR